MTIENNESLWAIDFTDFKVDGTSIASNGGKAVIDSGSYAIQLESSAYDKFKDYMNELKIEALDCDTYPYCFSSESCSVFMS